MAASQPIFSTAFYPLKAVPVSTDLLALGDSANLVGGIPQNATVTLQTIANTVLPMVSTSAGATLAYGTLTLGTSASVSAGITIPNAASGAGVPFTITGSSAASGSADNGGNLTFETGKGDGGSTDGVFNFTTPSGGTVSLSVTSGAVTQVVCPAYAQFFTVNLTQGWLGSNYGGLQRISQGVAFVNGSVEAVGPTAGLELTSSGIITVTAGDSGAGSLAFLGGGNIILATSTGTQIGTSTSQLLGFYGATPVVQQANASQAAITAVTDANAKLALQAIYNALKNLGLCAATA